PAMENGGHGTPPAKRAAPAKGRPSPLATSPPMTFHCRLQRGGAPAAAARLTAAPWGDPGRPRPNARPPAPPPAPRGGTEPTRPTPPPSPRLLGDSPRPPGQRAAEHAGVPATRARPRASRN